MFGTEAKRHLAGTKKDVSQAQLSTEAVRQLPAHEVAELKKLLGGQAR
jgi:hypothetical protein